MVYSDLLFFLGILPFSVLLSLLDRSTEYKNLILIITSLLVFSWGKPFAVCLLFLTSVAEWIFGRWVENLKENNKSASIPLIFDIVMNALIFKIFTEKYLYIKSDNSGVSYAILSVGIIFYVLRGFSYVYDVYKGKIKAEKNVFCLLTYMSAYFFMPVGPLVRYSEIEPMIRKRSLTFESINRGLNSFIYGLGKIVIITPVLKKIGEAGLNFKEINLIGCWIGAAAMLGFAYFLFTGFCDMSWGLGRIYGFDFERNYKNLGSDGVYKGLVKSCGISLINFFEEIVADISDKFIKLKYPLIIAFSVLTALLYKQNRVFFIVGAVVGVIIIFETTVLKDKIKKLPVALKFIYTYLLGYLVLGGLCFDSFKDWGKWLGGLAGIGTKYTLSVAVKYSVINNIFIVAAAFFMVCVPLKNFVKKKAEGYAGKSLDNYGKLSIIKTILTALLFVACIIIITSANVQI